ncbi:hydroxypyruvate isomerase family protein [Crenothrix polyspora]|uniref:Hydroxypyruvate isomerase n=1 Tax=Crenothrix polyspora TaxID=360316 RepID=A0A1R4H536_9GAMM|nr:TIM barrel protein [Crenothrix polyspora]SJM91296.1 Hydroxypyruvate isomerase [Crenothrix polyspora]
MLKFSANLSLLFTEVPLIERFKLAKQYGFTAVEIQFPYCINANLLRDVMEDNDLQLVLFNVDADDLLQGGEGLACVPGKRQQFQRAVDIASHYADILKPTAINVLPGRCSEPAHYLTYVDTFKDNLLFATQAFTVLGIQTVFEAINTIDMPGFIISNGEHMLSILNALKQPTLLMQYDIYHLHKMGEDVNRFISAYADKIGHIQFADCPGRGQPGTGNINFEGVFTTISTSTYKGWVGAEYNPVGTTAKSLHWLTHL